MAYTVSQLPWTSKCGKERDLRNLKIGTGVEDIENINRNNTLHPQKTKTNPGTRLQNKKEPPPPIIENNYIRTVNQHKILRFH